MIIQIYIYNLFFFSQQFNVQNPPEESLLTRRGVERAVWFYAAWSSTGFTGGDKPANVPPFTSHSDPEPSAFQWFQSSSALFLRNEKVVVVVSCSCGRLLVITHSTLQKITTTTSRAGLVITLKKLCFLTRK